MFRVPLYLRSSWCYTYLFFVTFCTLPFSELGLVGLAFDLRLLPACFYPFYFIHLQTATHNSDDKRHFLLNTHKILRLSTSSSVP